MATKTKVNRASYSLEQEYRVKLAEIAERDMRTQTEELRIMIDKRAVELGLRPVRERSVNE